MLKINFKSVVIISLLFSIPFQIFAQGVDPNFNPNKLIEDKVFSDVETFGGAEGVQKFLETKSSVLANTSPAFLARLKEPSISKLKQDLEDPQPNLGRLRTAAELIWDASRQSGLNPQVILVTLNKEQGLVTAKTDPNESGLQRALDHAMGFDCPDSTGCGNLFPGFYYQLFGNYDSDNNRYLGAAKSLMKSFNTPQGRGPAYLGKTSRVGDTILIENTMGGYEGIQPQQQVTILNSATASLYRYTPHVFNGNYNFWKFFIAWFRYPNGSLLKTAGANDLYIIQNGLKQLVPAFVATARNLNLKDIIIASPTEIEGYQTDKIYGPADNTIVRVNGDTKKYVFLDNTKHLASDLVIKQRGLKPDNFYALTADESALFPAGTVLTPKDGTIIRGNIDKAVYLVADGKIKMYSAYTFEQNKIKPKQITLVPDDEIASYQRGGFVPPLDGSLVKGSSNSAVYLVESSLLKPVLADIFKNRGFKASQIKTLSADEINSLAIGAFATPKERTFFSVGSKTGQLYIFKEGTKHPISSYVAKQRGITADYVFGQDVVNVWTDGIPVPPKDNTIVKGNGEDTIYLVLKGQLRPLTYNAFLKRKISPKKIVTLPQEEVNAYAKGEILEK